MIKGDSLKQPTLTSLAFISLKELLGMFCNLHVSLELLM